MTFRIDRFVSEENAIVLRVCGRMEIECLNTINELIEEETAKLALDLSEVTLANRDAATFLTILRAQGYRTQELPSFSPRVGH
jgi:hypothetical protein